ncbi:hypothetical protein [Corynebacterium freiburgense]|uniref:hypothetical protein n=1 Tax=Corynebacterium freiburgense TaxID=556548 RepID=UPI00041DDA99|nr:hypothetical protein [Corynebacterium freiburgense]WJZ02021.1 hypothetical protein CFREI_03605 [Corynebacterium freiburgense]
MKRGNSLTGKTLVRASANVKSRARQLQRSARDDVHQRLAPGTYVDAEYFAGLPPWSQHELKALAVGGKGVRIIGGHSAAVLWRMWNMVFTPRPVEYYLVRSRKDAPHFGRRLRARLQRAEIENIGEVWLTSRARTALDLVRFHTFEECFIAVCGLLANGEVTREELRLAAQGDKTFLRIIDAADERVESPAEAYFLAQVRKENLFSVLPQVSVKDARGVLRRPDFEIENTKILIEVSGAGKYGATVDEQEFNLKKATERLDALVTAGYTVWSYSAKQVFAGIAYSDVVRRLNRYGHNYAEWRST